MVRITINDIARECSVSLSTVSLVLNNNPRISEKTRTKVLEAIELYGYQPNIQAQGLASKSSHLLSLVLPDQEHIFQNPYLGAIIEGICQASQEEGYKPILDIANDAFIESNEYLNLLKSRRADGMLVLNPGPDDQYLNIFENRSAPYILLNQPGPNPQLNHITPDYEQAGRLAADHLLQLGHRSFQLHSDSNLPFKSAFIQTCREAGYPEDQWQSQEATAHVFDDEPKAWEAGGTKFSILSLGNMQQANLGRPALTVIKLPAREIGKTAVRRLLELFNGEIESCMEKLPVELVTGESTRKA